MTNIRTPIGFFPRRLAALSAGLAMAPCSEEVCQWEARISPAPTLI